MTEPDPCPFSKARLLTEEIEEDNLSNDIDLLADIDDSSEGKPRAYEASIHANKVLDAKVAILDRSMSNESRSRHLG